MTYDICGIFYIYSEVIVVGILIKQTDLGA